MLVKNLIKELIEKNNLEYKDAKTCMNSFLKGGATPAQISAFFTAIINKGFTKEEFEGLLEGIKARLASTEEKSYDFYIYSFIQNNLSLAICFILFELENTIFAKFKNLYSENSDEFNFDEIEKHQDTFESKLKLSLANYNQVLKNIMFLKPEIGLDHLISLLELSLIPINSTHNLIIISEEEFSELDLNYDFSIISHKKTLLIVGGDKVKLLSTKNNNIAKTFSLPSLERFDSLNFTKAISDQTFLNFCISLILEVLSASELHLQIKSLNKIDLKVLCKAILNTSIRLRFDTNYN